MCDRFFLCVFSIHIEKLVINVSVSKIPTEKYENSHGNATINVSFPVFVLSGWLHRIKGVNLDESNFPMCALAVEKSFLTANRQKK